MFSSASFCCYSSLFILSFNLSISSLNTFALYSLLVFSSSNCLTLIWYFEGFRIITRKWDFPFIVDIDLESRKISINSFFADTLMLWHFYVLLSLFCFWLNKLVKFFFHFRVYNISKPFSIWLFLEEILWCYAVLMQTE